MGHDVHFLQRLERLPTQQVDLALSMYRDPELVRFVLSRARLPGGAERVALALEDRPDSPHIIVARDGGFVTCLGEGMSVGDLPVVTRGQLDLLGERMDSLRAAGQLASEHRETQRLFKHLHTCGPALSREDFSALAMMLPLVLATCLKLAAELTQSLMQFRRGYRRSRYRRMTDKARADMRWYWETSWLVGHLVALYGSRTHELPDLIAPHRHDEHREIAHVISMTAMYSMTTPIVLRGVWTAARAGRAHVSKYKALLQNARSLLEVMMNGLPLMTIGLRHRSARAEVQKLLERSMRKLDAPLPGWNEWDRKASRMFLEPSKEIFDTPDEMEAIHRNTGRRSIVRATAALPEGHPLRFDHPEDVPDELAFLVPVNGETELYGSTESRIILVLLLPWVARADIAELYYPARALETYRAGMRCKPDLIAMQLEGQHRYFLDDRPVRRTAPKPGRNQPCPCGSGKKHKRCCGA